jgi:hypothetical protein
MMKTKKPKASEPSAKDKLSADFTERLEKKWREQGDDVLEAAFKESPTKIAEMIARLVSTSEPPGNDFEACKTKRDIGIALLKSIGMDEFEMTEEAISEALERNDEFIAKLQAIRAAAEGQIQ